MTPNLERWSLLATLLVLGAVVLLWPVLRHLRSTGTTGITVHKAGPVERVVGAALGSGIAFLATWAVAVGVLGRDALGLPQMPAPVAIPGHALVAAGVLVVAAAQAQMGRAWRVGIDPAPTDLVTRGLYRHVRNPIYGGMFLALGGIALLYPSLFSLLLVVQLLPWIALQVRLEEAHLLRLHGERYLRYAARAGRFLPGVGRLSA